MKLTVLERFQALNVLPDVGNIVQMRMRQKLIEKVGLSVEELEEYDVKPGVAEGTVQWKQEVPQEKEIDLKGPEIAALAENLKKVSNEGKLNPMQVTLYDKLVGEEES
jgi:hypothetical protein